MPDTKLLGRSGRKEKVKCPRLLVAPAVEDPPGDHEVQEEVNDPDEVHPIDAMPRCRDRACSISPTPPSTRVIPSARMIEIRTERYSNAPIG